jgi:hypothetical protein
MCLPHENWDSGGHGFFSHNLHRATLHLPTFLSQNFKALFAVKEFMEVVVVVGIIMRKSSWRRYNNFFHFSLMLNVFLA